MDKRLLGKFGAAIERALSVKEGGPRFWFHDGAWVKAVVAYPPYFAGAVALGSTYGDGHGKPWLQLRIGVRYDANFPGYIFPCLSLKFVQGFTKW